MLVQPTHIWLGPARYGITEKQCHAMKTEIISKMGKLFPDEEIFGDPIIISRLDKEIRDSVK